MISFSVVIPIYNSSEYIVEAIGSVLSQTILPKEIIIVDDFSDDCLEAFKKISHLKTEVIIRYIQHYENRNVAAANHAADLGLIDPAHLPAIREDRRGDRLDASGEPAERQAAV